MARRAPATAYGVEGSGRKAIIVSEWYSRGRVRRARSKFGSSRVSSSSEGRNLKMSKVRSLRLTFGGAPDVLSSRSGLQGLLARHSVGSIGLQARVFNGRR